MHTGTTPAMALRHALLGAMIGAALATPALAADHRDAPLIGLGPRADFTEMYFFRDSSSGLDQVVIGSQVFDVATGRNNTQYNIYDAQLHTARFANPVAINPPSTISSAFEPRFAVDPVTGNLAVTYVVFPDAAAPATFLRGFDANGNSILEPTRLNMPGGIGPRPASIDAGSPGSFISVVPEFDGVSFDASFSLRRISANPLNLSGPPVPVNVTGVFFSEPRAEVVATHNGALVAVAGNNTPGTSLFDIQVRDLVGNTVGDPVKVNQTPALNPDSIDLARPLIPGDGDRFHVVWDERDPSGRPVSMHNTVRVTNAGIGAGIARRLTGNNTLLDAENPKVAINRYGTALTTFQVQNVSSTGLDTDVYGQYFAPNGIPVGGPFRVNLSSTGNQRNPSVGAAPTSGAFIVAFTTDDTALSPTGVDVIAGIDLAPPRKLRPDTIVADGFGTPWTDLRVAGGVATHNGGNTDSLNFADIVADPELDDTNDGVLRLRFESGQLRVDFPHQHALPGDLVRGLVGDTPLVMTLSGRVRADERAIANAVQLVFGVEFLDLGNPLDPRRILDATFDPLGLDALGSTRFTDFTTGPLRFDGDPFGSTDPDQVGANWFAAAHSLTDPEIWVDDIRITLAPVPEPSAFALTLLGLPVLLVALRRRGAA